MARNDYSFQLIKAGDIRREFPCRTRYRMEDAALRDSVARQGIVQPLVVAAGGVLVSGHRRLQAALAADIKEIPALMIQEKLDAETLFIHAVLFNWRQDFSELDQAWTIRHALQELKIKPEVTAREILPALGLPPEKYFLEEYPRMAALHPDILEQVAEGKLPFRGCRALVRFSPQDQAEFARLIGRRTALSSNQLLQAGEWLADLLQAAKLSLSELISQKGLETILARPRGDKRQIADQFCRAVAVLRFPSREERQRKFRSRAAEIEKALPDVQVEAPPAFEAEGFMLKARIRRPESLEKVVENLGRHRTLLNSLFDIML